MKLELMILKLLMLGPFPLATELLSSYGRSVSKIGFFELRLWLGK